MIPSCFFVEDLGQLSMFGLLRNCCIQRSLMQLILGLTNLLLLVHIVLNTWWWWVKLVTPKHLLPCVELTNLNVKRLAIDPIFSLFMQPSIRVWKRPTYFCTLVQMKVGLATSIIVVNICSQCINRTHLLGLQLWDLLSVISFKEFDHFALRLLMFFI